MNLRKDEAAVRSTLALSQLARYEGRPEVDVNENEKFFFEGHGNEICSGLYLGDYTSASERMTSHLKELNITGIINCTIDTKTDYKHQNIEYVNVAINDNESACIKIYFNGCTDFINKHINKGGNVLVHCQMGSSRSATIVIAYLMKYHKLSLENAFIMAKQQRCIVSPNIGFWNQLKEFNEELNNQSMDNNNNNNNSNITASASGSDDEIKSASCKVNNEVQVEFNEEWCQRSVAEFQMNGGNVILNESSMHNIKLKQALLFAGFDFILGRCMVNSDITWFKHICCETFNKEFSISYLYHLIYDPESEFMELWGSDFGKPRLRKLLFELGADETSPLFMTSISEDEE